MSLTKQMMPGLCYIFKDSSLFVNKIVCYFVILTIINKWQNQIDSSLRFLLPLNENLYISICLQNMITIFHMIVNTSLLLFTYRRCGRQHTFGSTDFHRLPLLHCILKIWLRSAIVQNVQNVQLIVHKILFYLADLNPVGRRALTVGSSEVGLGSSHK